MGALLEHVLGRKAIGGQVNAEKTLLVSGERAWSTLQAITRQDDALQSGNGRQGRRKTPCEPSSALELGLEGGAEEALRSSKKQFGAQTRRRNTRAKIVQEKNNEKARQKSLLARTKQINRVPDTTDYCWRGRHSPSGDRTG